MNSRTRYLAIGGIALCVAIGVVLVKWPGDDGTASVPTLRIAVTPYQDTTLMLYGIEKGYFSKHGVDLVPRDSTWNDQIEFVAGGGCDLAMATIDEIVAKSKNLRKVGKRVVYIMPAWIFEGMIFVCRDNMQTLSELRNEHGPTEAARLFLEQLRSKKIAVPEGSVYEQALRKFILEAGYDPDEFAFINSQLEVGINGLTDRTVGIAAAGIVQRLEAQRRGYKIALNTEDLGVLVLTGFICDGQLYEENHDLVTRFLCGWYDSVDGALDHLEEDYQIVRTYLDERGAKAPSFDDFKAALTFQRIPRTPDDAKSWFYDPNSLTYWKISWDAAVQNLRDTGKAEDAPETPFDFVGNDIIDDVIEMYGRESQ